MSIYEDEKVAQTDNVDLRQHLDELEQYGYTFFRAFERPKDLDTLTKILEAKSTAGINLQSDDIINSHRVGNPNEPRQIFDRLKSVDTKFHILRNARKFQQHDESKHIPHKAQGPTSVSLQTTLPPAQPQERVDFEWRDHQDKHHVIQDERDLVKFGHSL